MNARYEGQSVDRGIVRFTADWCVPCKSFAPIFDGVATGTDTPFYTIDIEEHGETAHNLRVMSIPAVFSVQDGHWTRWAVTPSGEELAVEAARLDSVATE